MTPSHAVQTALIRWLVARVRARSWERSLIMGERLGDLAHQMGLRRRVAEANLAHAFPERTREERDAILRGCYRELGRVLAEYPRLAELARAPRGRVLAEVRGMEHLEAARGRGAILLSGHYSNFELACAMLGQMHPVDVVVRPLSNPGVDAMLSAEREGAGLGAIPADRGIRRVYESLRAGRWVALLADQDARRHGVFVPFLGRPASTALGPARIALSAGVPIIMGFVVREPDRRLVLEVDPPLEPANRKAKDAALRLTEQHAARLEARVRARPDMWFWLHRRWKTVPLAAAEAGAGGGEADAAGEGGVPDAAHAVQGWAGERRA